MKGTWTITYAVGVTTAVFGVMWALQGFGVLGGTRMSNTTTWSIVGPIAALIGTVVAVVSWRKRPPK